MFGPSKKELLERITILESVVRQQAGINKQYSECLTKQLAFNDEVYDLHIKGLESSNEMVQVFIKTLSTMSTSINSLINRIAAVEDRDDLK